MFVNNYNDALAFIHGRTKFKKIPTLDRMRDFMKRLGNPHEKVKAIHVTGTNGKGSTTAYLRDLIAEQGYNVGTFTSPFIEKFNERISVNGKMISDEEIVRLVNIIGPVVKEMDSDWRDREGGPTEFEIVTAMMFVYFAEGHVDYAVIEVGIGGLFDSTNVITPLMSVITTVAMDHAHILGDTIAKIATHKAGIIKYKKPILIGKLPDETIKVVKQVAKEKEAPLLIMDKDFSSKVKLEQGWGEKFDFSDSRGEISNIHISMEGFHQIENATLAIETFIQFAELEGINYSEKDIKNAVLKTRWLGRFELLNQEPLIVIDGAHNTAAMKRIAQLLRKEFADREVYVILASLADKQPNEMLDELLKLPNVHVTVTCFEGPRKVTKLADFKLHDNVKYVEHWQEAIGEVISNMSLDDMLLITGSLYFISEVRNNFEG